MFTYFRKSKFTQAVAAVLSEYTNALDALLLRAGPGDMAFADSGPGNYACVPLVAPRLSFKSPVPGGTSCKFRSAQIDRLGVQTNSDPNAALGDGDFTVEFWMYPKSYSTTGYIQDARDGAGNPNWADYLGSNKKYSAWNSRTGALLYTSVRNIPLMTWTHIAAVRRNGVIYFYINGRLDGAVANTDPFGVGGTVYIGTSSMPGGQTTANTFDGYLASIHWMRSAKYADEFTPNQAARIESTPFTALLLNFDTNAFQDAAGNNAVWGNSATKTTSAVKKFSGNAMVFTGASYVEADPISLTGNFTIEGWVYQTARGAALTPVISQWKQATGSCGWEILLTAAGLPQFWYGSVTEATYIVTSASAVPLNTWTHLAVSRMGNHFVMFMNGAIVGTYTGADALVGRFLDVNVILGNCINSGGVPGGTSVSYFTGYMDDFHISKDYATRTAPFSVPTDYVANGGGVKVSGGDPDYTLVPLHLKLDQPTISGTVVNDGKGNPATNSGVTFSNAKTLYRSYSAVFNGTSYIDYTRTTIDIAKGDFTVEGFFNFSDLTGNQYLFDLNGSGANAPQLLKSSSNNIAYMNGDIDAKIISSLTVVVDQWYHIALCRRSGVTRLFINGVMTGTPFVDTVSYATGTGRIGNNESSTAIGFRGAMSDFRISLFGRYKANFTAPAAAFLDYWDYGVDNNWSRSLTINAIDSSRHNKNNVILNKVSKTALTVTGNPSQGAISPYRDNYGVYFATTASYTTPYNVGYNFGIGDFTVEFFIRPDDITTSQFVFSTGYHSALTITISAGQLLLYIAGSSGSWSIANGLAIVPVLEKNRFYHIAVTREGDIIRSFVDGAVTTGTVSTLAVYHPGTSGLSIGESFVGILSNVHVVKGQCLYNAAFEPPTSKIKNTANTVFLGAQSRNFVDNSSLNAVITRVGTPMITTIQPFKEGYVPNVGKGSIYFDGSGDRLVQATSPTIEPGSTFEISFGLYLNALPGATTESRFIVLGADGTASSMCVSLTSGGQIKVGIANTGVTTLFTASGAAVIGEWGMFTISVSSGNATIYKNGVAIASGAITTPGTSGGMAVQLGYAFTTGYASQLNGYLADLHISKISRHSANFAAPTSPSVADGNSVFLLQGDNNIAYERNAFTNIEVVGAAQVQYDTVDNGSFFFDGAASYLRVPSNVQVNPILTGDCTAEFWLNLHQLNGTGYSTMFTFGAAGIRFGNSGYAYQLHVSINATTTTYVFGTVYTQTNALKQWIHVAMVKKNGVLFCYINGKQTAIKGAMTQADPNSLVPADIQIGYNASTSGFYGLIKDFKLSNFARYNGNFIPPQRKIAQA